MRLTIHRPKIFWTSVAATSYWCVMVVTFSYRDTRDFRAAQLEEERQAWIKTPDGVASLQRLRVEEDGKRAAEESRQREMMGSEEGRAELAGLRQEKIASLRHREIKLLYDMARTRGLLEGSQKRIRELAIQEKERELARQASSSSSPIAPLPQTAA